MKKENLLNTIQKESKDLLDLKDKHNEIEKKIIKEGRYQVLNTKAKCYLSFLIVPILYAFILSVFTPMTMTEILSFNINLSNEYNKTLSVIMISTYILITLMLVYLGNLISGSELIEKYRKRKRMDIVIALNRYSDSEEFTLPILIVSIAFLFVISLYLMIGSPNPNVLIYTSLLLIIIPILLMNLYYTPYLFKNNNNKNEELYKQDKALLLQISDKTNLCEKISSEILNDEYLMKNVIESYMNKKEKELLPYEKTLIKQLDQKTKQLKEEKIREEDLKSQYKIMFNKEMKDTIEISTE
ncbi:MAG: hypothetical protein CL760_05580 [Chloroflexi bacterium]|nr:hypothetical protein [Chloroflexota bacterium]|tara:strand:+ start:15552 stop:16448 length:897 start_codon:yes stop_codon:yes gene_type:complete